MTLAEIEGDEFLVTKEDIQELYELACNVGGTFASIRCGEDDDETRETRLTLEKPYLPLGIGIK
ncbi:MAG: hypothetical protein GY801_11600 [bacterium]|nr:hypothetical protein [bacterium]